MRHIAIFLIMLVITSFSYSQDTIPPSLLDFAINPKIVDVSDSSQVVNITMSLVDDISGIHDAIPTTCSFPNGTNYYGNAYLITGTSTNGVWRASIPVSFGMPSGFANISIGVKDAVGNFRNYNFQDLQNLGFDSGFGVLNSKLYDTIPPSLLDISINPKIVDVSDSSQVVNITMSLVDDISGIHDAIPTTCSFPNGTNYYGNAYLITGISTNGVWRASIPVSFGMPSGFANISLGIKDAVGNFRNYNFQDLQNLGFNSSIEVMSPL